MFPETFLLLLVHVAPPANFTPRLRTLRFHVERLEAIAIPTELESEKRLRLSTLTERIRQGVDSEEGFRQLCLDIDATRSWLLAHAIEQPTRASGSFEESTDAWSVETPALRLMIQKSDLQMRIERAGHVWLFAPSDDTDAIYRGLPLRFADANQREASSFHTGYSAGMTLTLSQFADDPALTIRCTMSLVGDELVLDLMIQHGDEPMGIVQWPKAPILPATAEVFSVIPRMQGMLLPGDWAQLIQASDLCNSRSFYMPWWGQIERGHGMQLILETSDDAGGFYDHPAGGPTRIGPRWYPSMEQFRYARRACYVFSSDASYVRMAKRYRRYVQETGQFVGLNVKVARTPALTQLIGSPVIHIGALYHFVQEASLFNREVIERNHSLNTFEQLAEGLRRLSTRGVEKAYVHLDGWGFYGYDNGHPDVLPVGAEQGGWEGLRQFADTCDELGYLFAVHDQYRDFYFNAVSFDDRLTATRADGSREEHSTWCGGPQTILSPRFAPGYVRRNHDAFAEHGIKVRGAYLDVFAVVPLEESFQPTHPVSRTECARYRRECFDLLRARGYVVSSEEPADYLVPALDLVHHGPYATYPHIGGGEACGIPVPLFSLVYHDSILLPWEMGEDGGWGVPRGDSGRLHCLLNTGLPYLGIGAEGAAIEQVQEAAKLAEHCAFLEMVDHEFLDASQRRQRTTFADGTQVTVDFDQKSYEIEYP